ncbi:peptide chain release factor N(5)-glutamine methyltransferase [Maribius pontilimi]|uniref:Release factor glutamine methyltransferase n=1 Tax=Palleronia pontilimi TaxID=1964209 RepID=A0A934IC23_9RHOB|nr:peptide chain release factor N(5)-glutamine methyltransferase [Palleronia pontilimi]MBJ3761707.1 peptide chain release factor N(5)-glutamine methyltransferase [Palleronia pontilimi]
MTDTHAPRTGRDALAAGVARLRRAGIPTPERDARLLMAAACDTDPGLLVARLPDPLDPATGDRFDRFILARCDREPVSRILGRREFWGRLFRVTPAVLDPRPETESLVELALAEPFDSVLDLGTGSGCIALTLLAERPRARATATDLSPDALQTASANAALLGVEDRVRFERSDWFDAVQGRFDLIVSNPPYIHPRERGDLAPEVVRFDPDLALFDTEDGLSAYRRIAAGARSHLAPDGRLLVEIGWQQRDAVIAIFRSAGLAQVACHTDLGGRDRVISARLA